MLKGVEDLADAVKVTMGPKVLFGTHQSISFVYKRANYKPREMFQY